VKKNSRCHFPNEIKFYHPCEENSVSRLLPFSPAFLPESNESGALVPPPFSFRGRRDDFSHRGRRLVGFFLSRLRHLSFFLFSVRFPPLRFPPSAFSRLFPMCDAAIWKRRKGSLSYKVSRPDTIPLFFLFPVRKRSTFSLFVAALKRPIGRQFSHLDVASFPQLYL